MPSPKKLSTSRPEHLSHMPIVLYTWLIELDDESAKKVWEYLDGTGENSLEMVEVISDSHPKVVDKLCGFTYEIADTKKTPKKNVPTT